MIDPKTVKPSVYGYPGRLISDAQVNNIALEIKNDAHIWSRFSRLRPSDWLEGELEGDVRQRIIDIAHRDSLVLGYDVVAIVDVLRKWAESEQKNTQ